MGDPSEVKQLYEQICTDNSVKPNAFISQQMEIGICRTEAGYLLSLAGNNYLANGHTRLEDSDMTHLCAALHEATCIDEVDLRYNNISDISAHLFASLLKESVSLQALNLMCNNFTQEGAKAIAESLHDNSTLKMLKMNGNKIGNAGGMDFAAMLQINTCLEVLDLNDCDLGMESVLALATVLRQNKFVKYLNVGRPLLFSVQEETTVHMGLMLRVNSTLRELHLVKYSMTDFGAERLAEGLYENSSLKHLNLSSNRITRDGAKHLAKLLEHNQTLEVLQLGQNRLENAGATILAKSLRNNFGLRTLSVVDNQIKGDGLVQLAECLDLNRSIEQLYIWGNIIEPNACKAFKKVFDQMRLNINNTDVTCYEASGEVYLSQTGNGVSTYYYYSPLYGPESKINQTSLLKNNYSSPVCPTNA